MRSRIHKFTFLSNSSFLSSFLVKNRFLIFFLLFLLLFLCFLNTIYSFHCCFSYFFNFCRDFKKSFLCPECYIFCISLISTSILKIPFFASNVTFILVSSFSVKSFDEWNYQYQFFKIISNSFFSSFYFFVTF